MFMLHCSSSVEYISLSNSIMMMILSNSFLQRRSECEDKITNNNFQMTNKFQLLITEMILIANLQFGHSYLIII